MIVLVLLILANYASAYDDYYYYDYDYYDYYDYDYDYGLDYYLNYYDCLDVEFCIYKEMWVYAEKETKIGNTSLVEVNREYYDIKTESAIMECTPSLSIKDFADVVLSCLNDVEAYKINKFDKWDLIQICEFRRKGWLEKNGTISSNLTTTYNELDGGSDKIDDILSGNTKVQLDEQDFKKEIKMKSRQKSKTMDIKSERGVPFKATKKHTMKQTSKNQPIKLEAQKKQSEKDTYNEKKEKKKYLKSMDMTKMPKKKVYDKLLEISWILDICLRECVENVLELYS